MAQYKAPRFNFEDQLSVEAGRVLDDVVFKRAPIQTRLLEFLLEKTLDGAAPPTQYEIAVFGLGKEDDYDLESNSYPRVQISRLRRRIENYYARNQPKDGLRLKLEAGSYRLTLEPVKHAEISPYKANAKPEKPTPAKRKLTPRLVWAAFFGAIGFPVTLLAIMGLSSPMPADQYDSLSKPSTSLIVKGGQNSDGKRAYQKAEAAAKHISQVQLKRSFVSKPLLLGEDMSNADYRLTLNFGPSDGTSGVLFLALADSNGDILYSNEMQVMLDRPRAFYRELEASLVYLTSPTGAIAQAELPKQRDATASDYACFLTIENRRAIGKSTSTKVDECLKQYPDSEYAAFWYSRLAFAGYRDEAEAGRAIQKTGEAWNSLRAAMELDRYNPMANFIAAKVELAHGRCKQAGAYLERVLERGSSYPALVAATEASAAACTSSVEEDAAKATRIREMVRFNRDPDPLLHLYLMIASLAVGDREGAIQTSKRPTVDQPVREMEKTSALLSSGLADPAFAKRNEKQIFDAVRRIVWNESTANEVMQTLLDVRE